MSRGDFGYGTANREFRDNPNAGDYRDTGNPFGRGGEDNESYNATNDTISTNIFTINNNAVTLERCMNQIGTSKDSSLLRDRIHDTEQTTNDVINETLRDLRRFSQICSRAGRQQKLQFERLKSEFRESVERYNTFQKKVAEKAKATIVLSEPKKQHPKNLIDWGEGAGDDEEKLLANEERRQQMLAQEEVLEVDVALLQEREAQIKELEEDILDINEIFRDLGTLVSEQGVTIDSIEDNVVKAADNVEAGNEQLERAAYYQRKSRKKMCIIISILLVVAAIIVTIIVVTVKH